MGIKTTIIDIAKYLGTTPATVSRALNNHPSISEKTKAKILEAAVRLDYRRNTLASSLRLGKTSIIGVIVPSAEINFFGSVLHGIDSVANKSGYNILIYQSNESTKFEIQGIKTFLSARVAGILVSIAKDTLDYSHFLEVKESGVPIVFFDRANTEIGIHSVVIDDYKGAYIATEHLIKQGYKNIAHISGPQHIRIFNDRLKGFMAALQANNLSVSYDSIYYGNVSIDAGREAVRHFLALKEPPDAVFAVEDFTALGAIKELKENNLRIPQEFGVIGFANELFGEHITPTLSTIDQQTVLMGKKSFKLLMQLIDKKGDKNKIVHQKVVLEPLPIFRNSSSRLNKDGLII